MRNAISDLKQVLSALRKMDPWLDKLADRKNVDLEAYHDAVQKLVVGIEKEIQQEAKL